jgi:putative ABC transport system ATP-binding protein
VSTTTNAAPNDQALLIECRDVALAYRSAGATVPAVHGVSCGIRAGDRVVITGPSGSGKSTLLHLMAGLEVPTSGTVTWPSAQAAPSSRPDLVGVIFQAPSLIPALDVVANVALPLVLADTPDHLAKDQARAALDLLGLLPLAPKLPEELSGGQAQRVAIARALTCQPAVLLADEPTGQLDRDAGSAVIDVLLAAADATNSAVVVCTHDPSVSRRFVTRWSMHDGTLLRPGHGREHADNTTREAS